MKKWCIAASADVSVFMDLTWMARYRRKMARVENGKGSIATIAVRACCCPTCPCAQSPSASAFCRTNLSGAYDDDTKSRHTVK